MRRLLVFTLVVGVLVTLWCDDGVRAEERHGTSPLSGIVRTSDGTPVEGVEVELRHYGWGSHKWSPDSIRRRFDPALAQRVVARTTTDAAGRWRMTVPGIGKPGSLSFRAPDGRVAPSAGTHTPPVAGPPIESVLIDAPEIVVRLVDHAGKALGGSIGVRIEDASDGIHYGQSPPGFGLQYPYAKDGVVRVPAPEGKHLIVRASVAGVGSIQGVRIDPATTRDAKIALRRADGPSIRGVVRDQESRPVPGALVVATLAEDTGPFSHHRNEAYARTDAEGRYVLANLPGRYLASIAVWKAGHAITAVPSSYGRGGSVHLPEEGAFPLNLGLGPGRTIRGVVVDERGKPLPGAEVWLSDKLVGSSFPLVAYERGTSDAQGRFELTGLPLHAGFVRAKTDAHRLASYWKGDGPRGHRIGRDMPNVVEGVRLVLAQGESVAGRLVDAADKPIAGATVRLSYYVGRSIVTPNEPVWTDADGRFAFYGLPKIHYPSVRIDARGFAPHEARLGETGAPDTTIRVPRGGTVRGRVLSRAGKPVPDTSVRCDPSARSARTDAEGRFVLERLPPGRLTLSHGGPGGATGQGQTLVDLAEGEEVKDVELRLTSASSAPGEEAIAGRAVDEEGKPHAGLRLEIRGVGALLHSRAGGAVVTDAAGHFRVDGLVPGQYSVQPWPPIRRAPIVRAGTLDAEVTFPSRETYVLAGRVVDPDGLPIPQGVVEATHHGAGHNVMVTTATLFDGRFRMDLRRAASSYHLRVGYPGDRDGRPLPLILAKPVEVAGPQEPIEIRLVEAAAIRGVFRDPDGNPIQGVLVNAVAFPHPSALHMPEPAMSDAEGRFALTGLRPGTYRVTMQPPQGYEPPAPRQIKAPTQGTIPFELKRLATIAGRLVDAEGTPVAGVRVHASARPRIEGTTLQTAGRARTALFADAVTERDGRFVIVGLSTDFVYNLGFGLPPLLKVRNFVPTFERIAPSGDELAIRLIPAETIQGRVLTPDGEPAAQVGVLAVGGMDDAGQRDPRLSASVQSGPDGSFELGPLRAKGVVTLRAGPNPQQRTPERPWLLVEKEGVATGSRDVTLTLRMGVEIRGRVEGATPAELHRVEIVADSTDRRRSRSGGHHGRFRFDGKTTEFRIVGLEPGTYRIYARGLRREVQFHRIPEVTAPAEDVVVRRLLRLSLQGRLTGAKGTGWRAQWFPRAERGRTAGTSVADDGTFSLGPVDDGPGVLYIAGPDKTKAVWMELTPSKKPIAAKPRRLKKLRGKILDLTDKVRSGRVTASFGRLRFDAEISDDGYFEFEHLPPGPWTLTFRMRTPRGRIEQVEDARPGSKMVYATFRKGR